MRIGLLSPGSLPLPPARCTSVEIYAAHLARELSRHHPVTLYARGAKRRVRVRGDLTTRTWKTRGGTPYVRLVAEDLETNTPSLLQIENRIPFVLPLKKALPRVPLVLNLHSNVLIQGLPRKLVDRSLKRVDALVVNSEYLKQFLLSRYPVLREHQVHVIHPGIDLAHFPSRFSAPGQRLREKTRARLGVREEKKVLLYVGRYIPRKGIGELLDAFADVHRQHPNTELWIVGGNPSGKGDFHQEMRGKAAGLPVRFLGFIRQDR
ncbi:MAG: glycosyltransferase family 4 protein, partial [Tumebacillaceae bacterium]